MSHADSTKLKNKALNLSYFTVGYNIIEFIISFIAGILAGSSALIGYGSDSLVESLSGIIMIWRFHKKDTLSEQTEKNIEKKATHLIGITFFIFGGYVLYESLKKIIIQEKPDPSPLGILIAIASIIVMPNLFYMKYQTGKQLNSKSLLADSKQTLACLFMSISLLIGLGLNYLYGFWQADPLVGLIIVIFLFREGYETLFKPEE
jgi:divalent metal cation (Fe/Co/Zn/Cd) transporter